MSAILIYPDHELPRGYFFQPGWMAVARSKLDHCSAVGHGVGRALLKELGYETNQPKTD